MNAHLRSAAIGAVVTASLLVPLGLQRYGSLNREVGLERDRREAASDTTRRLVLALNVLADGTQALQRRAVQEKPRADRLDVAAHQTPAALVGLVIDIPKVDTTARGTSTDETGGVRDISFDSVKVGPFVLWADITSPPAPQSPIGHFAVGLADSMKVQVRLGCGEPDRMNNGVRPASVIVTVPKWTHAKLEIPRLEPEVCNPKPQNWLTDLRTLGLVVLTVFAAARD